MFMCEYRTILHGRALPLQAARGTGTLRVGQLRQRGLLLTVLSPATVWCGHVLWHLQTETQATCKVT